MLRTMVIGSVNMDMVTRAPRFPWPGETLPGAAFSVLPGGKGANQAVALGRLGYSPVMAGCVGEDEFGAVYRRVFRENGVDASLVSTVPGSTGIAAITVTDAGENSIIIVPGANAAADGAWLEQVLKGAEACDLFLLQLEIDPAVVFSAVLRLSEMGKTVMLDPAPARAIPGEVLSRIDWLTPNETELRALTASLPDDASTGSRIECLLRAGVRRVVHKAGAQGAYLADQSGIAHIPGFPVRAVDTTAAGDTFNAALAAGIAGGMEDAQAVRFANAAAAISVTAVGAQSAMPGWDEAHRLAFGE